MARPGRLSVTGGGGAGLRLTFKVEGVERTSEEFRQARRQINSKLRTTMQQVGQRTVLPDLKSQMPNRWGSTLFVKRDRAGVFIGSDLRGSMNRALGWWDFGGKRPLDHEKRVGPHILVKTLDRKRPQIDSAIRDAVMAAFDGLEHD